MLERIRWVLFDAVGTLIYPDQPVAEVYHAAARQLGSQLSMGQIAQRFSAVFADEQRQAALSDPITNEQQQREFWRRIVSRVIDDVATASDELFQTLWNHFAEPSHWRLFDDVVPAIAGLRSRGLRLGIASNFDARLRAIIAGHAQLPQFEAILLSSDVGFSKPDPRFFQAVERKLATPCHQIALVGDDEVNDVQGATAAGWRAVRLDRHVPAALNSIQTLMEL